MLVFEDGIVISLRPVSVSFAMRLRSRPGQLRQRPARPWRDESIRIGLRTLILTLLDVLTIAALLRAAVLAGPEVILCVRTRMKRVAAA